jgi:hypothetical protein
MRDVTRRGGDTQFDVTRSLCPRIGCQVPVSVCVCIKSDDRIGRSTCGHFDACKADELLVGLIAVETGAVNGMGVHLNNLNTITIARVGE